MNQKTMRRYTPTGIPGILAMTDLSVKNKKLYGYLVFADSKAPIDHIDKIRKSVTIRYDEEIPNKRVLLIRRLQEAYWKRHKKENAEDSQEEGFFSRAYHQFSESQLSGEWGESTIRATHTYFKRNVLPLLDAFGPNITLDNLDQIESDLLQKTKQNGHSFRDQNTDENFFIRMERINLILKLMSHLSEAPVPLVQFTIPRAIRKRIHREQIKSLPLACFLMLVCLLFSLVMTEPLALACALMVFGGLRTGEAAAVRFGDIRISSKRYATLFITHRINDEGVRTDVIMFLPA